jgi:hypothetical protein
MVGRTVIRIEDSADGPPRIEVFDAPFGHNIYVGPLVNDATMEHGGLINLLGIDHVGSIKDQGWRVVDPSLPEEATRNGLHVLWITHDHSGPMCTGDLQVGFNTIFPGHHYANPIHTKDSSLGPVTDKWITVYSDEALQLFFRSTRGKGVKPESAATG